MLARPAAFPALPLPLHDERLAPGRHTFAVRARDGEGDLDTTAASAAFKIEAVADASGR